MDPMCLHVKLGSLKAFLTALKREDQVGGEWRRQQGGGGGGGGGAAAAGCGDGDGNLVKKAIKRQKEQEKKGPNFAERFAEFREEEMREAGLGQDGRGQKGEEEMPGAGPGEQKGLGPDGHERGVEGEQRDAAGQTYVGKGKGRMKEMPEADGGAYAS